MSKYIHNATFEAAIQVASNLLPNDRREVTEGHGHDPESALVEGIKHCDSVYFEVPNGEIAGMAGATKMDKYGCYALQLFNDYPHTFAREARGM